MHTQELSLEDISLLSQWDILHLLKWDTLKVLNSVTVLQALGLQVMANHLLMVHNQVWVASNKDPMLVSSRCWRTTAMASSSAKSSISSKL